MALATHQTVADANHSAPLGDPSHLAAAVSATCIVLVERYAC